MTSASRKTYDEYLGHIVLDMMTNAVATTLTLSNITQMLSAIATDDTGSPLFPDDDITIALGQLVEADILHHDDPHYVVPTKTTNFRDAQQALEGSVMWKCKTISGYAPLVLKAMHDKKKSGFSEI